MERERDAATIELLKQLRMKLFSEDINSARVAAQNLAWLQEDGMALLKEALFGNYSRTVKKAAAYGLRRMKGRMKKLATEVLEQGIRNRDRTTKACCIKSLALMRGEEIPKGKPKGRPRSPRQGIKEVPSRNASSSKPRTSRSPRRS
jgi:hypothetical protein